MEYFKIKPVIKLEMFLFQPPNFTHKQDLCYQLSRTKSLQPMDWFNSKASYHVYFPSVPFGVIHF